MLVEAKMCTFTLESKYFIFNKCPIYTSDGASAIFITNKHETDYTVRGLVPLDLLLELFCRHHPRSPPMNRRHHLEITLSSPHIIMCDHLVHPLVIAISFIISYFCLFILRCQLSVVMAV
jgi:hypothetical protein